MNGRTLVLGGGGITGIAWMLGLLAGVAERGVDLRAADDVVGTSAGSVVGAQLATGVDVEERYAAQLADPTGEVAAGIGKGGLLRLGLTLVGSRDPQRLRARIGRFARGAATMPESERLAVIGARLPVQEWPQRSLRITAVDAHDGAFRVLDRTSGVPLVHAVASSCAVPGVYPPVTTGGTRYIDGGVRSPVNADLAAGSERVVVLAPIVRGLGPQGGVAPQVEGLRAAGSRVVLVSPDPAAVAAIGRNVLDPARRAAAARAGRTQAADVTDAIAAIWTAG
ncbi:patatin-like phospholipase family protein [Pseudonocardia sp. KRD-184]|uniref:patatin-like phospholipase family protein n=1 Tax=Pseudonocardia oceani TaxID=2792013 RepID=UPI001C4A2B0D|nr:patatin-like phospholipase family protein [Pseudonocardia oceani]MBW0099992.1 patatin-like phospholipase family protein [Pseudonocardia oceani]MBW0112649.1 patatin-like phospholipase family protein [Pseudonocardia oceani]MBW0124136.1 patatin-like phospholipase family protein [Pseudonocardia oceani]